MRKFWPLLLLVAAQAFGQAPIRVPSGRIEFAPVPELAFVAGIAETVQLGPFMLDPANRWTPGDQTRASGWKSRFPTQLIDTATGEPVTGVQWDRDTLELTMPGGAARDVMARLETTGAQSAIFRLRILTPSVVYGTEAAAINAARRWNAPRICNYPAVSFAACRKGFKGGSSDTTPLVLFIAPGTYTNQDFYLGNHRYVYVMGRPDERATLVGDTLATGNAPVILQIRNLNLRSRISITRPASTDPTTTYISNVAECCETRDGNGIFNGGGKTDFPWLVFVWNVEARMMGSPSNMMHWAYIEGRPFSTFEVNNVRILGTRGSSAVKSTMQNVAVRNSLLCVTEHCGAPNSNELTMHTPIDVPAFSTAIVYNNEFHLWRGPTAGAGTGKSGVLAAAIFWRLRQNQYGSDVPAYPNVSWDPPVTSQTTAMSPGEGWSAGPETFVDPAFWTAVTAKPLTAPTNPLTYKKFISFNKFVAIDGSLPVRALRDDGTHPVKPPTSSGGLAVIRAPEDWVERSVSYLYANTYFGNVDAGFDPSTSLRVDSIEPGAHWPRDEEEERPHAVELDGELPAWFRL